LRKRHLMKMELLLPNPSNESLLVQRYEKKLPLEKWQLSEFFQSMQAANVFPKLVFPNRTVNSIYLDDEDLTHYQDNVHGLSLRSKTRFRWYDSDLSKISLEYKKKTNHFSNKTVYVLKNPDNILPDTYLAAKKLIGLAPELSNHLLVRPKMHVRYERAYYTLAPEIRMTVDTEMCFRKLDPLVSKSFNPSPVFSVIEFKYPADQSDTFNNLIRGMPFKLFRHSKYIIGLESL
jgi:hypothetical protein